MPGASGVPSLRICSQPRSPIHWNRPLKTWPVKNGASQSFLARSPTPETSVRLVMARVSASDRPRRMNRLARVTMNDGKSGPDRQDSVDEADQSRDGESEQNAEPERPAPLDRRNGDDDAGKADHRADREIELPGDHQKRHGRGQDADLGRDVEKGDDALGAEHAGIAGEGREKQEDQNGSADRAQFRPPEEKPPGRDRADPLVRLAFSRCQRGLPVSLPPAGPGPATRRTDRRRDTGTASTAPGRGETRGGEGMPPPRSSPEVAA